jgi:hypothetical protein
MTVLKPRPTTAGTSRSDEQIGEVPTGPGTANRLTDLIRAEDERLAAYDIARELQRRNCPSGE